MKKITLLLSLILTTSVFAQFNQGFDAAVTLPAGWSVINGGDVNTWQVIDLTGSTASQPQSPSNVIGIIYSSDAHDDYLITPSITVAAGVNDYLSFYVRSRDALYPELVDVKISTSGATAADFTITALADVTTAGGPTFSKYGIDLTAYVGQTIYIGFYSSTTDMFIFDLDTVVNGPVPTCSEPTALSVSDITETTASFNYTAPAGSTNFQIEYGVAGFTLGSGTNSDVTGAFPFEISGLTQGTDYDVYIRTDCGASGFSEWTSVSFTTIATPPANDDCAGAIALTPASTYAAGAVTSSSVAASVGDLAPSCQPNVGGDVWFSVVVPTDGNITVETGSVDGSTNTDTVLVAYSGTCGSLVEIGCDDDSSDDGFFSKLALTALAPGSVIYIQALQYSSTFFPSTPGEFQIAAYSSTLATNSFQNSTFSYFPNPVKDVLTLSYNQNISDINVYNMLGQNVLNQTINSNEARVNVSTLANGNYIAKVNTANGVQTIKLTKE